jgi:hypothetical protein
LQAAHKSFALIAFRDEVWLKKSESLLRYHLLRGSPQEAWRIVQILKRVRKPVLHLNDYERLAVFKSRSCALALAGGDESQKLLVEAVTFRYAQSFFNGRSGASRIEGTNLAAGVTPYLTEIPGMQLIPGNGCRFEKLKIKLDKGAAKEELSRLLAYLARVDGSGPRTADELLILARALQLAIDMKNPDSEVELSSRLPPENQIPWIALPDPERRRLFSYYFPAERIEALPVEKRNRAQAIALEVLAKESDVKSVEWLGLVDLSTLSRKEKLALLEKLEKRGSFPGRAWVLIEIAEGRYQAGDATGALTTLRRLLLENEEATDLALDERAVDLAAEIFAEHRFDDKLQGALQAALPSRLWSQLIETSLTKAAFGGRANEFARIAKLSAARKTVGGVRERQIELLRSLSRRDLPSFRKTLRSFGRGGTADRDLMRIAGIFISELTPRTSQETRALAPFAQDIGRELRARLRPGDTRTDEINDLAQALESDSAWAEGAQSVRKGIVKVGVAKWEAAHSVPASFQLKAPAQLPIRELIYVPDQIAGQGWRLSTETR